jgi:hypothetical protein
VLRGLEKIVNAKKTLPTATEVTAAVKPSQSHPSLDQECRSFVNTACAAYHLNRAAQTMRAWACMENGPLRPVRINGRLAWSVADIKRLLNGGR